MSWRRFFRRRKWDEERGRELASYLEMETEENVARGMTRDEARRAAHIKMGNASRIREEIYEMNSIRFLEALWHDLRFAIRSLNKDRRFSLLAILALALGIGSATVIFSAIYGVIINTFGYEHPDQIVSFAIHPASQSGVEGREGMSLPEFLDYREQNHVLQDMTGGFGGFGGAPVLYNTGNGTTEFSAWYTTANLFEFMGTPPLIGRWATPEDTKTGATPVFMMTYKLWHTQFNSDPSIVGKSFVLNGVPTTLVGVMPPRFRWGWPDIWMPFSMDRSQIASDPNLANAGVWPVGRLKPGISLGQAAADLDLVAHRLAKIHPQEYPKQFRVTVRTLADRVLTPFKTLIYPLAYAVLLLLLIACSNVANLLLARATVRDREIAVRASLGATRRRLVQQLLVESSVLAAAGCVAGCVLAWVGIKEMLPLVPYNAFPQEAVIELNGKILLFAVGVAIVTTVLCGLAPAFHAMRGELQPRLTGTGKSMGGGFRHGKLRAALVIAEVALSIVLLIGAGLMMRTFFALDHIDLGFNPKSLLVTELNLPKGVYDTAQEKNVLFQQIFGRFASVPGIAAASVTVSPPPNGGFDTTLTVPGKTHQEQWKSLLDLCSEGYFQTLQLQLLRGRLFSESDIASARQVTVINRTFAQKYFSNGDPIGQKVRFDVLEQIPGGLKQPYFEIIGVVPDVKNGGLQDPPMPEAYIPHTITGFGPRAILVRTAINADSLLPTIRQQIWAVNSNIALNNAVSIENSLRKNDFAGPEFAFMLLSTFATIGLLLVVIGVFSVMAYSVSLLTHEIGIRMALGAQRNDILMMVLRKGLALIIAGIIIGVLVSLGLTRVIANQLWGVKPTDPLTFSAVALAVIVVGLLACLGQARRATRVDPLVALRHE